MRWAACTALLGALLWSQPAAADLVTPVFIVDDGESAGCGILNFGSRAVTVDIQVRRTNGTAASETGPTLLSPGQYLTVSYDGTNNSTFYCHFVGRVSAKSVRAAGQVISDIATGGKTKVLIPAQ